ncbi:HutD family protein [Sporomusa sp.]|uniref:HutD/Ves family protein n=1 Tax=Sporomusa sp. TaxID=2078658 RepID=UPI002CE2A589|nr:HutD family protein [Sporomusa sp.]HWR09929.1 HutD family protein [Sporomusa sp.]
MPYTAELIKTTDQITSNWSGGTTTQIAIYPKNSLYNERNFMWRLSSARVEVEESTFTSLPGIWRLIMVLEGELKLEHSGHHTVQLKPFEQDSFSGNWSTTSFGKVRDFNLMLAPGCSGELAAISIDETDVSKLVVLNPDGESFSQITSACYCVAGKLTITINAADTYELSPGDLLLLSAGKDMRGLPLTIINTGNSQAQMVTATIKLD